MAKKKKPKKDKTKSKVVAEFAKKAKIAIKDLKLAKGVSAHDLKGEIRAWIASGIVNQSKPLANKSTEQKQIRSTTNMVSTKCTKCNLRLVIPEVESHRCILCGCKELTKHAWSHT